jgi:hypothetical protein
MVNFSYQESEEFGNLVNRISKFGNTESNRNARVNTKTKVESPTWITIKMVRRERIVALPMTLLSNTRVNRHIVHHVIVLW